MGGPKRALPMGPSLTAEVGEIEDGDDQGIEPVGGGDDGGAETEPGGAVAAWAMVKPSMLKPETALGWVPSAALRARPK